MSEMIKRVEQAMFDKYVADGGGQGSLDEMSDGTQEMYRSMAHAVIEAMREPTRAMLGADGGFSAGYKAAIWREMIDAALA